MFPDSLSPKDASSNFAFTQARKQEERGYRAENLMARNVVKRPDKIQNVPGFHSFFKHFSVLEQDLHEFKEREFRKESGDIKSKRKSLNGQIKAAKSFQKFIKKNSEEVIDLMVSNTLQKALMQAQKVFDITLRQSKETLALFENIGIGVIQSVENGRLQYKLESLYKKIIAEGEQAISLYAKKRETLFLAGLFSGYKNELEYSRMMLHRIKFEDLRAPGTLDMVKTVGGSVKIITDSLIPSFVEFIHKKIVDPSFIKKMGLHSPRKAGDEEFNRKTLRGMLTAMSDADVDHLNNLYTKLTENYRSRGFSKSQIKYFKNYQKLAQALAK